MKTFTLKEILSFITLVMFLFVFTNAKVVRQDPSSTVSESKKEMTINPVIGDISFFSKYGYIPNETTDENLRIVTHFEYVENLLRQKDVSSLSPELQQNRKHLIDLFHQYKLNGKFPRNYDYADQRRPCFIDKDNTICAVGYLVEQTAGRKAAEDINARFKYDDLLDMHDAKLDNWIANSGLSKEEVAMIQPTYGGCYICPPPSPCNGNKVWACRTNNCVWECKCVNASQVEEWQSKGKPCDGGPVITFKNEDGTMKTLIPVPQSRDSFLAQSDVQNESKVTDLLFPKTATNGIIMPISE